MSLSNAREINFEVLRVLIMFFIVIWHSLVHGLNFAGSLDIQSQIPVNYHSVISIFNYTTSSFLMTLTAVAVNIYILVTGYFMVNSGCKWNKIPYIWLQTAFYSFIITLIIKITNAEDIGLKSLLFSGFPIFNNKYWFVTKYIGLITLAPFLSKFIQHISRKEYKVLLVILFVLNIYLFPYFSYGNIYSSSDSLQLFIFLFLLGGYIRLYNPLTKYAKFFGRSFFLYCLFITLAYIAKEYFLYITSHKTIDVGISLTFLGNNSFTFFSAVLLFLWAKHRTFAKNRMTNFVVKVAPFTLGVYLIHDNEYIRKLLWEGLNLPTYFDSIMLLPMLICISIIIFIICIFLDYIRYKLFSFARIKDRLNAIMSRFEGVINIE